MEKRKLIRNVLLMLVLMCFGLWFALHKDFNEILHILKDMNLGWGILICLLGLFYYGLSGLHIQIIAKRYRSEYTLKEGIVCAFSCALFNGITPLGCGQVAQAYVLKKQKISTNDSLSILWMDFIVFQSVVLCYVLGLLCLRFVYFYEVHSKWFLLVLAGFAVNSFVIVILWTMSHMPKLYAYLSNVIIMLGVRFHILKEPAKTKAAWENALSLFQKQISIMGKDHILILKLAGIQILRMTIFYALPFFVAIALGVSVSINQLLDIMALSAFIHMLNALTPLPGDSGWSESAFAMLFSTMFTWNIASAIMVIWRAATYHIILIVGMFLFLRFQQKQEMLRLCKKADTSLVSPAKEDYDIENLSDPMCDRLV